MRPLPQSIVGSFRKRRAAFLALLTAGAWTLGRGGGGAVAPPPPPPPSITVGVAPSSGSVVLGNQLTFTATVANTTDTSVGWSVNGVAGGSSALGTISPAGVYTAPADLPSPVTVQIAATSHADNTKSGSANVTVTSDLTLSLRPAEAVSVDSAFGGVGPARHSGQRDHTYTNALRGTRPPLQACIVPPVDISFTTRTRPGP